MADSREIRPTLFIGAGGTGSSTLVRIKARFNETFPESTRKLVRFLLFDTDPNHPPITTSKGNTVWLETGHEVQLVSGVPVEEIIARKERYREWGDELELDKLPREQISRGAKQIPQLGRLAFFYHYASIKKAIRRAIGDLKQVGISDSPALNVVLVSSCAGGTGTGMLIDLAYLVRSVADNMKIAADSLKVMGVVALPDLFEDLVPNSNKPQIRANAGAFLDALDHYTRYGGYRVRFRGETSATAINTSPFNVSYLLDAVTERGQTLKGGAPELYPILAEALFLLACSYLGSRVDSIFDNLSSLDKDTGDPLHCGLGVAQLHFNASRVQTGCAMLLRERMIRRVVLNRLPEYNPEDDDAGDKVHNLVRGEVDGFVATSQLTVDLLNQALQAMQTTAGQMVIAINTSQQHRAPWRTMPGRVTTACENYAQARVRKIYVARVDHNAKQLGNEATRTLEQTVYRLLDEPMGGVDRAQHLLAGIELRLRHERDRLQRELSRLTREAGTIRTTMQKGYRQMEAAASRMESIPLIYRRQAKQAREFYTGQFATYQRNVLAQAVSSRAMQVMTQVSKRVQEMSSTLAVLRSGLVDVADSAERNRTLLIKNWSRHHLTERTLDKPEDIDGRAGYYRQELLRGYPTENAALEANVATLFEQTSQTAISNWFKRLEEPDLDPDYNKPSVQDDLDKHITQFTLNQFASIQTNRTIETEFVAKYPTLHAQQQELQRLIDQAAPLLNYDPVSAGMSKDEFDRINIIGVNDREQSQLNEMESVRGLVSTNDASRYTTLVVQSGIPIRALKQFESYWVRYIARHELNTRRGNASPTPFPNSVGKAREIRRLFMWADALGWIDTDQIDKCILRVDGKEHEIGSTKREGLAYILKNADQHEMLKVVENHIAKTYRDRIAALDQYIDKAQLYSDSVNMELYLLALSERESLNRR